MADDSSNNLLMKVGGAVFATVVAPLVVALGLKWFDSPPPQQQPAAQAAAITDAPPAAAQPITNQDQAGTGAPDRASPPDQRREVVDLFNGHDLTGFHVRSSRKDGPRGANSSGNLAAAQAVFSVRNGLIHATGQHVAGLVTDEEYSNYRLTLQFKWGDQTWPPREEKARLSGVLLHAQAAASGGRLSGIRCILGEGETGDLAVVGTDAQAIRFLSTAVPQERTDDKPRLDRFQFRPNAAPVEISRGYVSRLGHAPRWKDVKGFRGRRDMENPHGEWNTVECLCRGDRIEVRVNGKLVNVATHCSLNKGHIVLQSIYAEVFFQKIQLEHLPADLPGA